jgi:hypothetical protein
MSGEVREVRNGNRLVPYLTRKLAYLLMRKFEEGVENMQLMHQLESGGMNRVSAKITEKIGMLLQHDHIHAHAGEE